MSLEIVKTCTFVAENIISTQKLGIKLTLYNLYKNYGISSQVITTKMLLKAL